MSIVTIPGGLWIPEWVGLDANGAPIFDTARYGMTATANKVGAVIRVPRTGTLDKFEVLLGVVTQAPGNGLKFSFQDISSGVPDGALDQYRVVTAGITSGAWLAPGLMTSDGTDTGTKRSVTKGDALGCVIQFESFTAGDSLLIKPLNYQSATVAYNQYAVHDTAGSFSKEARPLCLALKYNDGTYEPLGIPMWLPITALNNVTSFNSGTSPDERGLLFQVPYDCEIDAVWFGADVDNAADLVIYDSGNSVLKTLALSSSDRLASNWGLNIRCFAPVSISANTTYRVVVKPGASSVGFRDFDVSSAAHMGGVPLGTSAYYTERTDAGAWTNTTTKRPWMGIRISGIDTGSAPVEPAYPFIGAVA